MLQLMLAVAVCTSVRLVGFRYDESTLPISKFEAIRLAEEFVVRNDYTDRPASRDPRMLTAEPIVLTSSVDEEWTICSEAERT
jgi:hypothetical protein